MPSADDSGVICMIKDLDTCRTAFGLRQIHWRRNGRILAGEKINVESLILLEARPCAGESDEQIVAGASDFERINNRYAHHLKLLKQRPTGLLRTEAAAKSLRHWAAAEHEARLNAVRHDPLLPELILPSDYLGKRALAAPKRGTQRSRAPPRVI
jgi:DNA-binding transcriptional regulator PaaX